MVIIILQAHILQKYRLIDFSREFNSIIVAFGFFFFFFFPHRLSPAVLCCAVVLLSLLLLPAMQYHDILLLLDRNKSRSPVPYHHVPCRAAPCGVGSKLCREITLFRVLR